MLVNVSFRKSPNKKWSLWFIKGWYIYYLGLYLKIVQKKTSFNFWCCFRSWWIFVGQLCFTGPPIWPTKIDPGNLVRARRLHELSLPKNIWLAGGFNKCIYIIIVVIIPIIVVIYGYIWWLMMGYMIILVGGKLTILKNMSSSMGLGLSHTWNGK